LHSSFPKVAARPHEEALLLLLLRLLLLLLLLLLLAPRHAPPSITARPWHEEER